jgi:hypothetical protein
VADFRRNRWPDCVGISGRFASDYAGYVRGLNTIERIPPEFADYIENEFLQRADDLASKALDCFLAGKPLSDPDKLRSGWSRFVMSLLHRHPERIKYLKAVVEKGFAPAYEQLRADYDANRRPTDPPTFDQYERTTNPMGRAYAVLFKDIVDSENVGNFSQSDALVHRNA